MTPPIRARILYFLFATDRSGVPLWLLELLPHLAAAGFPSDVATLNRSAGVLDDELARAGARVWHLGSARHYLRFTRGFRAILATGGPYQILHSTLPYGGIQLRLARHHGIPARIAHSHADTRPQERVAGMERQLVNRLERWLVRQHATRRLAVSELAAEGMFGSDWATLPQPCTLLPCGRDYSAFLQPVDREACRHEVGLPLRAPVLGNVGRLSWQKNQSFLLQITAAAARTNPEIHLLLIGSGELRTELEAEARALGIRERVVFAGDRHDVPALLQGAIDVFVFPSRFEGLPLGLLEAQAAGRHCLVANQLTEQGIVVPELVHRLSLDLSAATWAEAALALAGQRMRLTQREALDRVLTSEFALDHHAAKVIRIYERELAAVAGQPTRQLLKRPS